MNSKDLEDLIIKKVEFHRGLKGEDLLNYVEDETGLSDKIIEKTISELVQASQLKRLEYMIPSNKSMFYTFYLPIDSRIY